LQVDPPAWAQDVLSSHDINVAKKRVVRRIELVEGAHLAAGGTVAAREVSGQDNTRRESRVERVAAVQGGHPRAGVIASHAAKLSGGLDIEVHVTRDAVAR
jgi:hypothetical protein